MHGTHSQRCLLVDRPEAVARIATPHTAYVRFVQWDASGHRLVSVDDSGTACVWAMQDHATNAWGCTYKHNYGRGGVVAVEMLRPNAGPQLPPGCLGWMVVTGDGAVHVTHQDPHTREYRHASVPLVAARLGVKQACIALREKGRAQLACGGGGQAPGVRVFDVEVTVDLAQTKVGVRWCGRDSSLNYAS